jgi:RsiW-degrading membrane proteinase PrsW (M82 family)
MRYVIITILILVLAVLTIAGLFTVQNGSRLVDLSLSVGVFGVELKEPMPVPVLLWIAFGGGLVIGGGWGIQQRIKFSRRIRKLQSKYAKAAL